jgi:integrase
MLDPSSNCGPLCAESAVKDVKCFLFRKVFESLQLVSRACLSVRSFAVRALQIGEDKAFMGELEKDKSDKSEVLDADELSEKLACKEPVLIPRSPHGSPIPKNRERGGICMKGNIYPTADGGFRVRYGRCIQKRFRSLENAERFLTGLRFKEDEGTLDARDYSGSNPLAFDKLTEEWLRLKAGGWKPNTLRENRLNVRRAVKVFGQANVKSLGYGQFERFLADLDLSQKSKSNIRSTLSTFYAWAGRAHGVAMPDIPEVAFELGWRNVIDLETQAAIIAKVREIAPYRCYLGIKWLATYIAIRPNEMLNLKESQVAVNGLLVIPHPKEKTPKLVPMLEEDIALFKALPRSFPGMPFFRHEKGNGSAKPGSRYGRFYFWKWWKRACKALGIEGVDLYGGCRHSGATALGKFFSEEEIQKSGTYHKSNKAFGRYFQANVAPTVKMAEKLVELSTCRPDLSKTSSGTE